MINLSKFGLRKGFKLLILFLLASTAMIYGIIGFNIIPILMALIAIWIIYLVLDLT